VSLEAIYITLFIGLEQQDHSERSRRTHEMVKGLVESPPAEDVS
jgi:hypothetical protein